MKNIKKIIVSLYYAILATAKNWRILLFSCFLSLCAGGSVQAASIHLLNAIEQVESGGRADAIGDNGKAVGCMQIHKTYVDEVNRILGKKKFTYADRKNKAKSREMTSIYLDYWAKQHKLTDEVQISRLHNGGSMGHKKKATLVYAEKIKKAMKGKTK
jgi:hypothetical protein